jgi:glutathione S-transferase
MATPIVYGTEFSTYVRSVRMAFEEKSATYDLVDVSVIKGEQKQPAHVARNPFGTVPAFAHDDLKMYETTPILRYVDQVIPGPTLTPESPRDRARMNQIMSIVDYHGYVSIVTQIVVQRLFTALVGPTDERVVAAGIPKARLCLREVERIMNGDQFLAGGQLSLADLYLVPLIFYLRLTPEKTLLDPHRGLQAWWETMSLRPSAQRTAPNFG